MIVNEETYHQINEYLSGELKGRSLDKFKAELKENSTLQEAVASQKLIIESIEIAREKELKTFLSKAVNKKGIIAIHPKLRIALASAAVIALLAVAIISLEPLLQQNKPTTAREKATNDVDKSTKNLLDNTLDDSTTIANQVTTIDSQTLAIVETPTQEQLLLDAELLEDYKTDESEIQKESEFVDTEENTDDLDGIEKDKAVNNATLSTAKKANNNAKTISTTDSDIVVRSDELLRKKSFPVYAVALDSRAINLDETSVEAKGKETRKERKAREAAEDAPEAKPASTISRNINVEYWKSVVNYKGYQYNGTQVKLYGVDQQKPLKFNELDNRLYVQLDGKNYFLEKNAKYNRLVEVTNPSLLKVLNE